MKLQKRHIALFFLLAAGIFITVPLAVSGGAVRQIVVITVLTALLSFLFSLVTHDYSWTDRLWSVSPVVYAFIYAFHSSFSAPAILAAALIALWGARLSFNFARRGGYSGSEDYRWKILHARMKNPLLWGVFNLLFIAGYQQALFILFTLPLSLLNSNVQSLNIRVFVFGISALCFLILETAADQQQYTFQQAKYHLREREKVLEREYEQGFRSSGLFSYARHPNYLGELGFWWSIYAFSVSLTVSWFSITITGPVLLTLLFIGSTRFTESITESKYEEYKSYQAQVWPILPRPLARREREYFSSASRE